QRAMCRIQGGLSIVASGLRSRLLTHPCQTPRVRLAVVQPTTGFRGAVIGERLCCFVPSGLRRVAILLALVDDGLRGIAGRDYLLHTRLSSRQRTLERRQLLSLVVDPGSGRLLVAD